MFFERMVKLSQETASLWVLNVFLAVISTILGLLLCYFSEGHLVVEYGFFHGYNGLVALLIFLQASDGLIVALVMKYADNIVKAFATSSAIVLTCLVAAMLGDFLITLQFIVGAALVALASYTFATG